MFPLPALLKGVGTCVALSGNSDTLAPSLPPPPAITMSGAAPAKNNPADFLKQVLGRPVVVKLNSGVDYRGGLPPCPAPLGTR